MTKREDVLSLREALIQADYELTTLDHVVEEKKDKKEVKENLK